MFRLYYRLVGWLRLRRIMAEDEAAERAWQQARTAHTNPTHGDRIAFMDRWFA